MRARKQRQQAAAEVASREAAAVGAARTLRSEADHFDSTLDHRSAPENKVRVRAAVAILDGDVPLAMVRGLVREFPPRGEPR